MPFLLITVITVLFYFLPLSSNMQQISTQYRCSTKRGHAAAQTGSFEQHIQLGGLRAPCSRLMRFDAPGELPLVPCCAESSPRIWNA